MTMITVPPPQQPPQRPSHPISDPIDAWCSSQSETDRTSHSNKNHNHPVFTRTKISPRLLTFDPQVRVRYVPSLDDLTRQEQMDTWYSSEEYMFIRRREHRLVKELSRQVLVRQKNDEERLRRRVSLTQRVLGLQTSEERDARYQHIRVAQFLVLYEQARHGDPERLAWIYSHIASESAQQARDRGLNVEIVLQNLDLCSDSSHHRKKSVCEGGFSSSGNSNMRHRRWSADSSTSAF
jgi:hypothetical protein